MKKTSRERQRAAGGATPAPSRERQRAVSPRRSLTVAASGWRSQPHWKADGDGEKNSRIPLDIVQVYEIMAFKCKTTGGKGTP
jgi:hypothetical protein